MKVFESALLNIFVSFFIGGLVSMLTITNPLSKIPLFLSLTTEMDDAARRRQARKACIYSFIILTVSLFGGVFILEGFGISYGALRIAGGITISLIGYRMLFQSQDVQRPGEQGRREIAFFPLALPGISGPGAIAVVIGISTEVAELRSMAQQAIAYSATVFSIFLTVLVVWTTLRSARFVTKLMGQESIDALSRLMGFLLVCIGVQFIGSGVRTFIAGA
jgi:multiple antibiotic resistance protein